MVLILNGNVRDGSGGASKLVKTGSGELDLFSATANTYTGGTEVRAGTLKLAAVADYLLSGGSVVLRGGSLDLNGMTQKLNSTAKLLLLGGEMTNGTIVVQNSEMTSIQSGTVSILSGNVSGSGGLTVTAGGEVVVRGEVHLGGSTVLQGKMTLVGDNRLSTDTALSLTSSSGTVGELVLTGTQTVASLTLDGGNITGGGVILSNANFTLKSGSIAVNLSGGVKVKKSGTGTVVLHSASDFTGGTEISGGVLDVRAAGALGNGAVTVSGGAVMFGGAAVSGGAMAAAFAMEQANGAIFITTDYSNAISLAADGQLYASGVPSEAITGISGVISGSGTVNVTSGNVALTNTNNSYTGTTNVTGGVLTAGAAGVTGTGRLNVASLGSFTTGGYALLNHLVHVDGAVNGALNMTPSSRLSGTGIINGALQLSGGIVAGSNLKVSSLTLSGTTIELQNTLANWQSPTIKVTSSTASSITDGVFKLKETTAALLGSGGIGHHAYTIIDAQNVTLSGGTLVDASGSVLVNSQFLKVSLEAVGGSVNIVVDRASYSAGATTKASKQFGDFLNGLGSHFGNANDPIADLLTKLNSITSTEELNSTLRAINPSTAYANMAGVAVKRSLATTTTLDAHLDNLAGDGAMGTSANFGVTLAQIHPGDVSMITPHYEESLWKAWTAGYASQGEVSGESGSGKMRSHDGGMILGLERAIGNLQVGLVTAVGQGASTFDDPYVLVESDHWHVGGYSSVSFGSVTLDASAMWGTSSEKSKRQSLSGRVEGTFNTTDTQLGLGVALNVMPKSSKWELTPVARLKFIGYTKDAFDESGAGLAFRSGKVSGSTWLSKLGLKLGRTGDLTKTVTYRVDGAAYWVHDFVPQGKSVEMQLVASPGAGSFFAAGQKADVDAIQINLGMQAAFSEAFTLRLSGQQDLSGTRTQTTGVFSVALNF